MEIEQAKLYFVPSCGEFLKVQPGTGDNLSPEDVAAGFTDYVIWNRFRAECLDIDGELPMECVDSGMVLLMDSVAALQDDAGACEDMVLKRVLEFAYGGSSVFPVKVTSKNSIFKNLVATLRAGSSFKVANTTSIRHFSFLPSLGLTQIFLTKAIFRGALNLFYSTRVLLLLVVAPASPDL